MKKIFLFCLVLIMSLGNARADEGMWLLKLMQQQHLEDSLRKAGLLLPPEALYSETSGSLRECIGIFGGGCTGEVVSGDGLILTNHHCGFSYVHEMSGIGHDYMKDGYFAKNRSEELRTPDHLTFTFVLRIVDVTKDVEALAKKQKADEYTAQSNGFLTPLAERLFKKSDLKKKKGVKVRIVPFFGGNQFYMFYEQEFRDIRLVANPPHNIGQFGGNSDNWMWPRQNADFAMFRIYADKNGDPAPYSKDNVPLKVKKFLPISLAGPEKGDYTMIMGFPGTTTRYLTAAQVALRCNSTNAPIILAGNPLLAYYKNLMDRSDELRLLLEDEYFGWGNTIKNFGGMNEAVEKNGLIAWKQQEEARFRRFAKQSGKAEYQDVIDRIATVCEAYKDTIFDSRLFRITLNEQGLYAPTTTVDEYAAAVKSGKEKDIKAAGDRMAAFLGRMQAVNKEIDLGKVKLLTPYFVKNNKLGRLPAYLEGHADVNAYFDKLYKETIFADSARYMQALERKDADAFLADPLYKQWTDLHNYRKVFDGMKHYATRMATLQKLYQRGLCEMYDWAKAPDANFTLRMTYGHVTDLKPRDGVMYDWRTVLDGMFEKESKTESDYFINERLRTFYNAGNYGPYAREDGKLQTCFLSNNDITGGNSGSGVLNAKGELIGLAFDGNIESLSSDLKFNPALQRCINVDIRYVLFIIDTYGGADYILDELDIRK